MTNLPKVKTGIIAVSRDCFPIELAKKRLSNVLAECEKQDVPVVKVEQVIENEKDVLAALEEIKTKGINALVIYLGNFGPEGPTGMLARKFDGPVMFAAAAEETMTNLISGRGDAYCGMLNASYNAGLKKLRPHIPHYPVGLADEVAVMIREFIPVARTVIGVKNLKVFSFGPRPQDFYACNAPIRALFDIGVEIMENSELDMLDIYNEAAGHGDIDAVVKDMARELGTGNSYPDLLPKLAQFEVALTNFMNDNLGASSFGVFANKCWPGFEKFFKFVPCYVNSRLAARGIPVACEVDIYGAISEYMAVCATEVPATLLDINNTVPPDMYEAIKGNVGEYGLTDLFMGFHCGNTPACCLVDKQMKFQLIMHRLMEPGKDPDITRGTLEGRIRPGEISLFRLQSRADTRLAAYIANGEVIDAEPGSFGGIGIFGIKEMARFYRYVLINERFPHHAGIAFKHCGKTLYAALKMLGVEDVYYNKPASVLYPGENPF